jgi:hypothetical protein
MKSISHNLPKNITKIKLALLFGLFLFLLTGTLKAQITTTSEKSEIQSTTPEGINMAMHQGGSFDPAVKTTPLGRKSVTGKNWEKGGIFQGYTPDDENLEYRTGISKTFRNPDGTQTAVFCGNAHYKDENGAWQDVNYNVTQNNYGKFPSYKFCNTNAEIKSFFPELPGTQGVVMSYNGNDFSWWNNPKMRLVNPQGETSTYMAKASTGQLTENKIIYSETYPGINDEFVVLENGIGVENNIIINYLNDELKTEITGASVDFSQFIPLPDGWQIYSDKIAYTSDFSAESFMILPQSAEKGFVFNPIVIFDNKLDKKQVLQLLNSPEERITPEQKALLENIIKGTYKIHFVNGGIEVTVSFPQRWLLAENRSFPVTIDPAVTILGSDDAGYTLLWDGYYVDTRIQSVLLSSDLTNAGIYNGYTITAFELKSNSTVCGMNQTGLKIRIKNTAATTTVAFDNAGYTNCWAGNQNVAADETWYMHTFTTNYVFNSAFNLLADFTQNMATYNCAANQDYWYFWNSATNSSYYRLTVADAGDPQTFGAGTGTNIAITPYLRITFFCPPSTITVQPVNQVFCTGQTVDFTVAATDVLPLLSYQWQYLGINVANGTPAGAIYTNPTSPTLSVSGAMAAGVYTPYTCIVSNGCNSVTSAGVSLTVVAAAPPATPGDPTESAVLCNDVLTRTGAPPGGVTWFWQGQTCGNNTLLGSGATYTAPSNGTYYIRARDNATLCWSNGCGSKNILIDNPSIITNPLNTTGCNGTPLTFSVVATGAGLSYQWQENGINLANGGVYSGVTTDVLSISNPAGLGGRTYRCIVTGFCAPAATSTAATLTVLAAGLSGTITVPGSYATLRLAFNAINANGLAGPLNIQITASVADNNEAILNANATCGNIGYPITIYPTGAGPWTLSGGNATSLITLNGADNVTFDGRLNQVGAANNLIISNTDTSGCAMKLMADACTNTIKYCEIRGVSRIASTGVILFSTGTLSGNDNNLISYCNIHEGATTPSCGILSLGTIGKENEDNTISNCNIYNMFHVKAGYSSFGVRLDAGSARWTIKSNSIYQTAARVDNGGWPIYVNCPTTNEFTIDGNYIGGNLPLCAGGALTWTSTAYVCSFYGIMLSCSNTGISTINNNTIQNIHFTGYGDEVGGIIYCDFAPIGTTGRINVTNNTIGNAATGSLWVTMNTNGTNRAGITAIIKGGDGMVMNNNIGSFSVDGTIVQQVLFNGIQITGSLINDVVISGNTLGHATTANSIQTIGANPPVTFGGIYFGTNGNYTTTVSNNTIANITLSSISTIPFFVGLFNQGSGGTQTIIGNTIKNITTLSRNVSFATMPAAAGIISNNTTTGGLTISQNLIYGIATTTAAANPYLYGIKCYTAGAGNRINGNFIHSLFSNRNGQLQYGIELAAGSATISNNMIRLGIDANGASLPLSVIITGIYKNTAANANILFNSVYIGGNNGTATTNSTFAFRRTVTGVDVSENNIFYNARTGAGNHFAVTINNINTFTSNYNDLFSANVAALGSINGGGAALNYGAWQAAINAPKDANSINLDPLFSNPLGNAAGVNLHINVGSPNIGIGIAGTGILTDYDNEVRKTGVSPNGPCIGADELVLTPKGANAYGIYSPGAIGGTIEDCEIYATGGTPGGVGIKVADPLDDNWTNVLVGSYQVITASNYSCLNTNMTFTTASGTPNWLFGNGANPLMGATSPFINVKYASLGRKNIIESVKLFRDFVNITMSVPNPGSILGAPSGAGCPTTYSYTSSLAGSPGFTYAWQVSAPGGCTATIACPTCSTTDVTFVNQTGVNQVFVLTLIITTECCGPLDRVIRYITIYPSPLTPYIPDSTYSLCTGASQALTVNPVNPAYSYEWYDASTGGTLLGTGSTYTVNPVLSGVNTYWVQATNSFGCSSPRNEVVITGNDTPPPTVPPVSVCGTGDVTLVISSPVAGYTYNWYSGSCGGTLLQSSTSTSFTTNIGATTTFYVCAVPIGCGPSACTAVTATVIAPPNPIIWLGVVGGLNNWFNTANWSNGCLPTCATNVRIPNLAIDPDIGFNATANAACMDMDLQAGAILSFSDTKAELDVCGNMTHAGIVTTGGVGLVKFMGSVAQTYTRTGTGDFHNVTLDNSAAVPTLTIGGGNLVTDATGIFEFVSGKVVTGANNLIIINPAVGSITGYSTINYVIGNLRRYLNASGSYDFPLGNTNAYELANLNITSTTGLTYLTTNFTNPANATGSGLPLIESLLSYDVVLNCGGINATTGNANGGVWTMTPDAGTANYNITLYGRNYDNAGVAHTIIKRVTAGPGAWAFPGAPVSNSNVGNVVTCVRSGITGFSQFGIARTLDVLPISLLSFAAACTDNKTILNWSTASETNNDFFSIERSMDGTNWEFLANIYGAGNSNLLLRYAYTDNEPFSGNTYYRLKQTDFNGQFEYFGPVSVNCESSSNTPPSISYYPNPFTSEIMVDIQNLISNNATVTVYDVLGNKILEKTFSSIDLQNHVFSLQMEGISSGVYTISFSTDNFTDIHKVVKY